MLRLSVNISGGHSSVPASETSISVLSRAITRCRELLSVCECCMYLKFIK